MRENLTKLCSSNHIVQIKKTGPPLSKRKTQGSQYVLNVLYVLLDGVNNWIGGEGEGEQERDQEPAQIAEKGQFLLWNWQNVGKGRAEYETEYKIL